MLQVEEWFGLVGPTGRPKGVFCPTQLAKYAVANGIASEASFGWWVLYVLGKKEANPCSCQKSLPQTDPKLVHYFEHKTSMFKLHVLVAEQEQHLY